MGASGKKRERKRSEERAMIRTRAVNWLAVLVVVVKTEEGSCVRG